MQQAGAWFGLFVLAALILTTGIRGQSGRVFAVFFAPSILEVTTP